MTPLQTIITRVIDRGWDCFGCAKGEDFRWRIVRDESLCQPALEVTAATLPGFPNKAIFTLEQIIFDIPFAKALWPENEQDFYHLEGREISGYMMNWERHLFQYAPMTNDKRLEYIEGVMA